MGFNVSTPLEDMVSEYTGYIGVGTDKDGKPAFQARVVFDTGSTNLWVASVLCVESPCRPEESRKFYDPERSLTQEEFSHTSSALDEDGRPRDIDIMFGTGELKGPLHVDTYRVGPMTVKRQPFAMIREMTGDVFTAFPFEGILGLAFKSLSFGGIEPFFERVIKQKLLERNEFAFYLNQNHDQPSAILWGGVDKSLYDGKITLFPVVQAHYWALELIDFKIGGTSILEDGPGRVRRLIVDSGTTYFTAPTGLFDEIVGRLPQAACRDVEDYPTITFVLRGVDNQSFDLDISQKTYMVGDDGGGDCRAAFMELNINKKYGPGMILGEVFMRHFFTVFQRGNGDDNNARIGFALAKQGANPQQVKGALLTESLFQRGREAASIVRRHVG
jgi:pepsin A